MSRRRYLLGYDISDPRRLREVHRCCRRFGYPLQYSLFICDMDDGEVIRLKWSLGDIIAHNIDRVVLIDIGDPSQERRFEFMGVHPQLPRAGPTIV
ncbi:MAG: CRISPR-associated endonuclease Cas2 [Acidimicrobiales bacterium]